MDEKPRIDRIVLQSIASVKDPSFADQFVNEDDKEIPFLEYFKQNGIRTLKEDLVISCHGNTDLDLEYAKKIQRWVSGTSPNEDKPNEEVRIFSIQSGGLYFAKPSLEAANMPTVPVVSVPLDYASFLAPMVPSGHACIAGAGVKDYSTAARFAKEILTNKFEGVYVYNCSEKLGKKLKELGIKILGEPWDSMNEGLIIGKLTGNDPSEIIDIDTTGIAGIFTTNSYEDNVSIEQIEDYLEKSEKTVYVRGEDNLAFFAAKCLSYYNEEIFAKLKETAFKKSQTYKPMALIDDALTEV